MKYNKLLNNTNKNEWRNKSVDTKHTKNSETVNTPEVEKRIETMLIRG